MVWTWKKKTNSRTVHFFIPSPAPRPPPHLLKAGGDFRFGVFFKVSNNIWNLMTNFSKIEWFRFQISLMGGGGGDALLWGQLKFTTEAFSQKALKTLTLLFFMIERFSLDCRKTKTKTKTNPLRQSSENRSKHTLDWFVLKLIICNFSQVTLRFAHGLEKAVSQQQGGYQFFRNTFVFLCKMMLP